MKIRIKKSYVFVLVAGLLLSAVCPAICMSFSKTQESHACCPQEDSNSQDQNAVDPCCSSHSPILNINNQIDLIKIPVITPVVASAFTPLDICCNDSTENLQTDEGPPNPFLKEPIYIINKSFRI